jgi:hypothetical protein
LVGVVESAIVLQPKALEICTAKCPKPPIPRIATVWFGLQKKEKKKRGETNLLMHYNKLATVLQIFT